MENYTPFVGDEKQIVKSNMKTMLKMSRIELKKYYTYHKEVGYLQQACEKLFNSVELYLSYISGYRIYAHKSGYEVVKEKTLHDLFDDANKLHMFFYQSTNLMPEKRILIIYDSVYLKISRRINSIK